MDDIPALALAAWPNCCIPSCTAKVCTWGSESLCYPHEIAIVGKEEMDRRYNATHERPWAAPSTDQPNYMTRTFDELEAE